MRRPAAILLTLWLVALWAACGETALAPVDTGGVPADSVGAPPEPPADTTAPEPPPPEIIPPVPDSVEYIWIWPDTIRDLPPAGTVQFCAFAQWSNGRNGPTTNSQGIPVCDSILAANPRWKP